MDTSSWLKCRFIFDADDPWIAGCGKQAKGKDTFQGFQEIRLLMRINQGKWLTPAEIFFRSHREAHAKFKARQFSVAIQQDFHGEAREILLFGSLPPEGVYRADPEFTVHKNQRYQQ
jgi:hypothetical protein